MAKGSRSNRKKALRTVRREKVCMQRSSSHCLEPAANGKKTRLGMHGAQPH
jgi:hypothetical protein